MIRLANASEKKAVMTRLVENYDVDEVGGLEPSGETRPETVWKDT